MKLSAIDEYSTFLYHQGTNYASYRLFGAHFTVLRRKPCVRFCRLGASRPAGQRRR